MNKLNFIRSFLIVSIFFASKFNQAFIIINATQEAEGAQGITTLTKIEYYDSERKVSSLYIKLKPGEKQTDMSLKTTNSIRIKTLPDSPEAKYDLKNIEFTFDFNSQRHYTKEELNDPNFRIFLTNVNGKIKTAVVGLLSDKDLAKKREENKLKYGE